MPEPAATQFLHVNRAHQCSVPCKINPATVWRKQQSRLPLSVYNIKNSHYTWGAGLPFSSRFTPQRGLLPPAKSILKYAGSKRRNKPSQSKEKDLARDMKQLFSLTRHKTPRDKVTPWPQKSWSCPDLEAASPLPWHPLFPNFLIHFVPWLISCFKKQKIPKQPKCRN